MHASLTSALYGAHWSMYDKYEGLEAKFWSGERSHCSAWIKASATTAQNAGWTPSQCGRSRE